MVRYDEDGIPIGWQQVTLTEAETAALCAAADAGDQETAARIVDGAYARLYERMEELW